MSTLSVTNAFTRTAWLAQSSAAAWVRPITPCLAAAYAARPGTPASPARDALMWLLVCIGKDGGPTWTWDDQ